ncbi:hypothetical protein SBA4_2470061 [Candidatus Sulfopaludibacter sp. SbA4]|nr:hypothetical protein SBA4_2470061 [Candidatus Sulfopaludibacter sp. SbA4]
MKWLAGQRACPALGMMPPCSFYYPIELIFVILTFTGDRVILRPAAQACLSSINRNA